MTSLPPLLEIDDLRVRFDSDAGRTTHAVNGVSVRLERGRGPGAGGAIVP